MKINNYLKLIIAIIVSELAGVIGSVFTTSSVAGWYSSLVKPVLNPPDWIFGPVWTALYFLMGLAAFLIWSSYTPADVKIMADKQTADGQRQKRIKIGLIIFGGQLVLNTLWSIIFFGLHNLAWALVEIIILWLAILWTIVAFVKISRSAAYLLVPYILWVSFAIYLNYSLWLLNR